MVVGAGLVGLCTALSLRRKGVRNLALIDRGAVCGESSGASAGGLWPAHECLGLASPEIARKAWAAHRRLLDEFPCDYMQSGLLSLLGEGDAANGSDRVRRTRQAGFEADLVSSDELEGLEPVLRHSGYALHFPGDGSIHPLKLAAALGSWLRCRGVAIGRGEEGTGLDPSGPTVRTVTARASAGSVVIAAGAWTPLLTEILGWKPPIRPVRGTLLATEAQPLQTLRAVVVARRYYYWQLGCGPLAGGGSEEDVGFEEGVREEVAADIGREWRELFPALRDLPFTCRWSGFRPYCADMQPVIGAIPGAPHVYVSAGHFRKGIMLSPLSGDLLAEEIVDRRIWGPARAFRPERFPVDGASAAEPPLGPDVSR